MKRSETEEIHHQLCQNTIPDYPGHCTGAHVMSVGAGKYLLRWMLKCKDSTLSLGDHTYVRKDGVVTHYYKGEKE